MEESVLAESGSEGWGEGTQGQGIFLPFCLLGRASSCLCHRRGFRGEGGFPGLEEGLRTLPDPVGHLGKQPGAEDEAVISLRLSEAIDLGVLELLEVKLLGAVAVFG